MSKSRSGTTDISRSARVRELLVALSEQLEDGEGEKLVLTQRKPRPRGGRVRRALVPVGARAAEARLEVEQEAEHPADFE
jgi:hypothetical protein